MIEDVHVEMIIEPDVRMSIMFYFSSSSDANTVCWLSFCAFSLRIQEMTNETKRNLACTEPKLKLKQLTDTQNARTIKVQID